MTGPAPVQPEHASAAAAPTVGGAVQRLREPDWWHGRTPLLSTLRQVYEAVATVSAERLQRLGGEAARDAWRTQPPPTAAEGPRASEAIRAAEPVSPTPTAPPPAAPAPAAARRPRALPLPGLEAALAAPQRPRRGPRP